METQWVVCQVNLPVAQTASGNLKLHMLKRKELTYTCSSVRFRKTSWLPSDLLSQSRVLVWPNHPSLTFFWTCCSLYCFSSFAVVTINMATRGRCPTGNVNMGLNMLLSLSTFVVVFQIRTAWTKKVWNLRYLAFTQFTHSQPESVFVSVLKLLLCPIYCKLKYNILCLTMSM